MTNVYDFLSFRKNFSVAFCIIFYLTCAIPSLLIIQVQTANRKLYHLAENTLNARAAAAPVHLRQQQQQQQHITSNSTSSSSSSSLSPSRLVSHTSSPLIHSIGNIECHDKAWYYMDEQRWLDAIQETMLIILCIIRLVISLEHMTVAKSGIILIITLINSADLLAMSHSLQYHDVIIERLWMYVGLVLLSMGLFQMALIDIDGLTTIPNQNHKRKLTKRMHFLEDQNLCPLFRVKFIHNIK